MILSMYCVSRNFECSVLRDPTTVDKYDVRVVSQVRGGQFVLSVPPVENIVVDYFKLFFSSLGSFLFGRGLLCLLGRRMVWGVEEAVVACVSVCCDFDLVVGVGVGVGVGVRVGVSLWVFLGLANLDLILFLFSEDVRGNEVKEWCRGEGGMPGW